MNLISLIEGRNGEKLVQALICYASRDLAFRNAFSELFGYPKNPASFEEEIKGEDLRYDIELSWNNSEVQNKHIELKIWADFTAGQKIDLKSGVGIHGVLLPMTRMHEVDSLNPTPDVQIRTWEQFMDTAGKSTDTAKALFQDLGKYIGQNTIDVSTIPKAMRQSILEEWETQDECWEMYSFLQKIKNILPEIDTGFRAYPRRKTKEWCYGFKVRSSKHGGWFWIGFISDKQDEKEDGCVALFAQASDKMNELLGWPASDSATWWWNEGFYIKKIEPSGGKWTISSIRERLRLYLQPLIDVEEEVEKEPRHKQS